MFVDGATRQADTFLVMVGLFQPGGGKGYGWGGGEGAGGGGGGGGGRGGGGEGGGGVMEGGWRSQHLVTF